LSSPCGHSILAGMAIILLLIAATAGVERNDPNQTYEFVEKGTVPIEKRQIFGRILEQHPYGYLVEIDAPWESQKRTVTLRDDMLESGPLLETPAMRERRIEEGWAARGFAKVTTPDGQTAFVVAAEVKLAERARRDGLEAEPPEPVRIPPEALLALEHGPPAEAPAAEAPGSAFPWARRAAQAVLILAALVVASIIAKTTVFAED